MQSKTRKEMRMPVAPLLTEEELDALRQLDTCLVANAIESFHVRLSNTGFTDARVRCMFPDAPPMVGYAATARLRSGEPPIVGTFHDRGDFWKSILDVPAPRVLVLQDMDDPPGRGAFIGDMHAAILKALGCVSHLTNGAVRELPSVRKMGIELFAGNVAVSHAYAHIFDIGATVTVGGMEVRPRDLLHGDRHGVLTVPAEIAAKVPKVAEQLQGAEQKVIDFCRSRDFSVAKLGEVMKTLK
ncbi:MAG: RraA family protein [Candidatus Sulfotelmatobacter sp.]